MTTIFSVHGTFSSGPDTGEQWWQKESPFQQRLLTLVEAEHGEISYQPHIWDGENSETSRRAAGVALSQKFEQLEQQDEPYAVIAHSHGGSVVAAALMGSAEREHRLDNLQTWISIGTPFIKTKLKKMLFSRLGVLGKSVYVALLTVAIMLLTMVFTAAWNIVTVGIYALPVLGMLFVVAFAPMPLIAFHLACRFFEAKRLHLYKNKTVVFAKTFFHKKWVSLWHTNDEAIQGLRSVKAVNFNAFARRFAVGPISAMSVFILPVLIIFTALTPMTDTLENELYNRQWIGDEYESNIRGNITPFNDKPLVVNLIKLLSLPGFVVAKYQGLEKTNKWWNGNTGNALLIVSASAVFLSLSLAITVLVTLLARGISYLLSVTLNPLTMGQIRAKAFGSDTREDDAVDASARPMWLGESHDPLPEPLDSQLQATSDAAIGKVVPKFRNALRQLTATEDSAEESDVLSEYLTWEELIHTSYFSNEQVCKLIAYALTQSDGFRATTAFSQDPELETVAEWYDKISSSGPAIQSVS